MKSSKTKTTHHFRCSSKHYGEHYCNCLDLEKVANVARMPFNFLAEIVSDLHSGIPFINTLNGVSTYKCKECKTDFPCNTAKIVEKYTKREKDETVQVK